MRNSHSQEQLFRDALRRVVEPFRTTGWPHILVAIKRDGDTIWVTGAVDDEMQGSIKYAQKLLRSTK